MFKVDSGLSNDPPEGLCAVDGDWNSKTAVGN